MSRKLVPSLSNRFRTKRKCRNKKEIHQVFSSLSLSIMFITSEKKKLSGEVSSCVVTAEIHGR